MTSDQLIWFLSGLFVEIMRRYNVRAVVTILDAYANRCRNPWLYP